MNPEAKQKMLEKLIREELEGMESDRRISAESFINQDTNVYYQSQTSVRHFKDEPKKN